MKKINLSLNFFISFKDFTLILTVFIYKSYKGRIFTLKPQGGKLEPNFFVARQNGILGYRIFLD